jgi:hypothetical protein
MSVALVIQHAMRMRRIMLLWPVWLYDFFYIISQTAEKIIKHKIVF